MGYVKSFEGAIETGAVKFRGRDCCVIEGGPEQIRRGRVSTLRCFDYTGRRVRLVTTTFSLRDFKVFFRGARSERVNRNGCRLKKTTIVALGRHGKYVTTLQRGLPHHQFPNAHGKILAGYLAHLQAEVTRDPLHAQLHIDKSLGKAACAQPATQRGVRAGRNHPGPDQPGKPRVSFRSVFTASAPHAAPAAITPTSNPVRFIVKPSARRRQPAASGSSRNNEGMI